MDLSCNLMQWSAPGRFVDYFAAVVFLLWVASVGYSFVGLRQVHKSFALFNQTPVGPSCVTS